MSRPRRKIPRDLVGPTPERWRQGGIERLPRAIADEGGHPSRPWRAVDTLALMARKGTIAPGMRQAAEDFHALFALAQLDPLGAPDLRRVPHGLAEIPLGARQAEARKRVWATMQALGGAASPAGSCVWHVVGLQWSLKQWAQRMGWNNRPLSQETASGVLVGALGVLQARYGL